MLFRSAADRDSGVYHSARLLAVVFAASTPVLATTAAPRWVLALAGSLVVIIEGFIQVTRVHDRSIDRWQTGASLRRALNRYSATAVTSDSETALQELVDTVEELRGDAAIRNGVRMKRAAKAPEPSAGAR